MDNDKKTTVINGVSQEEFEKDLFEVMEEVFPEFCWNGELIKSSKYINDEES